MKKMLCIVLFVAFFCLCFSCVDALEPMHSNHSFTDNRTLVKPATCTTSAVFRYKCSGCSLTQDRNEGKPLGHLYSLWNYSTNDRHTKTCSRCGKTLNAKHIFIIESTSRKCMMCNYVEIGNYSSNHQHIYNTNKTLVKEATCTTPAVYKYKCYGCSLTQEKTEGSALGHVLTGEWKYSDTQHYKVCPRCNTNVSYSNHSFGSLMTDSNNKQYRECSVCKFKKYLSGSETPPSSGNSEHTIHIYALNKTLVKPATCSSPAIYRYKCVGCDLTKEVKEGSALAHTPSSSWKTDETYHYKLCTVCNYTITQEKHQFSDWQKIDNNYKQRKCSVCGYIQKVIADNLEVHFINADSRVDAIYIKMGDKSMFIDGGFHRDASAEIKYLQKIGVTHIDYYLGTHAHNDHVGAAGAIINKFGINTIYVGSASASGAKYSKNATYNMIIKKAYDDGGSASDSEVRAIKNCKLVELRHGNVIEMNGAKMTCIAPITTTTYSVGATSENNNSLVMRLEFGNNSFLLTGDAPDAELRAANSKYSNSLKVDVFKNAHHNSATAENVLSLVRPTYAVFTTKDGYLPSSSTLSTFKKYVSKYYIVTSSKDGSVAMISDGTTITVKTRQ